MLDISVVIVNYNSSYFLQLCLDALALSLRDYKSETIVIDNQSNDDSCQVVKDKYSWVKLIENATNDGFGKANNKGIALAQGRYILLLNPDTIIQKETLLQSIKILERGDKNAAVGVKMLDGGGHFLPESKRGLPIPEVAFYKAFGFAKLFPHSKRFARYYLGHLSSNEQAEVEVLAGAYMMCDGKILKESKGFDEDFFMYGEDIDLSYRITQKGYKIFYSPEFPIIHFKGESAGRDALWAKRFYDAMHLFSQKHFSHQGWLWTKILDLGIRVRKAMSSNEVMKEEKTDCSTLDVLVITSKPDADKWEAFTNNFKSVSLQQDLDASLEHFNAVLFLPDVEPSRMIKLMNENAGGKQFFFATKDYVLTSPSSSSQGEIYPL